jgi:hypothetical protein
MWLIPSEIEKNLKQKTHIIVGWKYPKKILRLTGTHLVLGLCFLFWCPVLRKEWLTIPVQEKGGNFLFLLV